MYNLWVIVTAPLGGNLSQAFALLIEGRIIASKDGPEDALALSFGEVGISQLKHLTLHGVESTVEAIRDQPDARRANGNIIVRPVGILDGEFGRLEVIPEVHRKALSPTCQLS